jgi:hypothetical protein
MDSCEKKTRSKMWNWIILGVIVGVVLATIDPESPSPTGYTVASYSNSVCDARTTHVINKVNQLISVAEQNSGKGLIVQTDVHGNKVVLSASGAFTLCGRTTSGTSTNYFLDGVSSVSVNPDGSKTLYQWQGSGMEAECTTVPTQTTTTTLPPVCDCSIASCQLSACTTFCQQNCQPPCDITNCQVVFSNNQDAICNVGGFIEQACSTCYTGYCNQDQINGCLNFGQEFLMNC